MTDQYPDIRLVAIDLDDTLLRDDHTVSARTLRVLEAVRAKGIHVVIATGRMYATAAPYARLLRLGNVPLMLFSGSLIQRAESKEILYQKAIPRDAARRLLQLAKKRNWTMQSYIHDVLRVAAYTDAVRDYERSTGAAAVVCGDDFYEPVGDPDKLLSFGTPEELAAETEEIKATMGNSFNLMRSKPTYLEIVSPGVSKGDGLQKLCRLYNIPLAGTMAFGNSQNDLAMLRAAGFSVAVANGDDNVRAAAMYVTVSNNEDGVAAALERFIL
ncbi:Cof-type HAD-IIB family hydrolase [Megasphaera vaginalis (ex Srinivasan et al. 2021)]|uniref:Cof-like hydrolase n=1 Tax=Megasphaera vaginalis (ex Srinivasan et al. 2021) TaxID=1111454 RepID=U7UJN2_9FIRM|nr:Cof-type HAD-IIB family hydrolase [Megasphaera vaginalis (ex Srinivasan et al. 2021)]ERT59555.1 Cof-like hydrolase [Megasphaera vaginalis (ex Srinivasan et al. 2021)]